MQILLLLSRGMGASRKLVGKLLVCPPKKAQIEKKHDSPTPSNISYSSMCFFPPHKNKVKTLTIWTCQFKTLLNL